MMAQHAEEGLFHRKVEIGKIDSVDWDSPFEKSAGAVVVPARDSLSFPVILPELCDYSFFVRKEYCNAREALRRAQCLLR
jgi:hypothetical protein